MRPDNVLLACLQLSGVSNAQRLSSGTYNLNTIRTSVPLTRSIGLGTTREAYQGLLTWYSNVSRHPQQRLECPFLITVL